ncbi:LysR family transcriptional regulator [Vibrio neptunius]|uniref:LysR family transcriptional regulator n=1 Tax=Vibrio neptunius TaxID=170651 RepID=A0ABS3A238_9VIBR|nr:LysR family transcriptional regulator [Vibrio neptunius]MBN3493208.1 LysR family transcriptional regulator [Vibrio neptunius]MBN3515609.1 LysR family transcriptional regulator [Vibrio neptunius]MBN3549781.1 LysR family transcriptional regulator [Vibrio neptunius]MBN3572015.1 LysR family transcriptional regulator [Vibrio neptunius]MBN3577914.1 LysR family transcriptional regulator [Vibrio neptunius]
MDVVDLRTFCQLAMDGNYRVASEHLHITQSALTKKIQRLEAFCGVVLFERGRQGASLTAAGAALLPEAQRIVSSFESYKSLTQRVAKGVAGTLNIGFGISSYYLAPDYIAKFKKYYPEIHITLNDIPSQKQSELLLQGDLHLSFSRLPTVAPLKGMKLCKDHLVLATHKSQIIDKNKLWFLLDSIDYLQLNPERGKGLSRQINMLLEEHEKTLNVVQEADDIQTLLALVSANLGFTIVPASVKHIANENVAFWELSGVNSSWDVGLIWNEQLESFAKDNFIQFVEKMQIERL